MNILIFGTVKISVHQFIGWCWSRCGRPLFCMIFIHNIWNLTGLFIHMNGLDSLKCHTQYRFNQYVINRFSIVWNGMQNYTLNWLERYIAFIKGIRTMVLLFLFQVAACLHGYITLNHMQGPSHSSIKCHLVRTLSLQLQTK